MEPGTELVVIREPRGVVARDLHQVRLIVGEGGHRITLRCADPSDLLDRRRSRDVSIVGAKHQVGALDAIQDVRATADERVGGLPGRCRISLLGHHEGRRRGDDVEEVGGGMAERHNQGFVVGRLDPDLVLRRVAGQAFRCAEHDAQHVGRCGGGGRVKQPQPRAANVLGDQWRAVAEFEIGPDRELVGQPVGADLPARCKGRVRLTRLVEARQAGVQLEEQLHVRGIGDERRVQRSGRAGQVAEHGTRRQDLSARCADGQRDHASRDERGNPCQTSHAGSRAGAATE